jgi:hypothetical protein
MGQVNTQRNDSRSSKGVPSALTISTSTSDALAGGPDPSRCLRALSPGHRVSMEPVAIPPRCGSTSLAASGGSCAANRDYSRSPKSAARPRPRRRALQEMPPAGQRFRPRLDPPRHYSGERHRAAEGRRGVPKHGSTWRGWVGRAHVGEPGRARRGTAARSRVSPARRCRPTAVRASGLRPARRNPARPSTGAASARAGRRPADHGGPALYAEAEARRRWSVCGDRLTSGVACNDRKTLHRPVNPSTIYQQPAGADPC